MISVNYFCLIAKKIRDYGITQKKNIVPKLELKAHYSGITRKTWFIIFHMLLFSPVFKIWSLK